MSSGPFELVKRAACQFYKSPTTGSKVNSSTPFTFAWDTACYSTPPSTIDISLLSAKGIVFQWANVDFQSGSYQTELSAEWWGSQPSIQLQVGITASGTPLFLSPFAAGPVFTALNSGATPTTGGTNGTATGASIATGTLSPGYLDVKKLNSSGLTRGQLAAAVVLPILAALVAVCVYVFFSRRREAERRAAWVENVDKRMSTISENWQSMSNPNLHNAAASRHSIHSNGTGSRVRPSVSVYSRTIGGGRHSSVIMEGGNPRLSSYADLAPRDFATEDVSQLGPRARALSAAAAEGRPLSSIIAAQNDLPPLPTAYAHNQARARSRSNGANSSSGANGSGHDRSSVISNNPYASAMANRHSSAIELDEKSRYSQYSAAVPRPRVDSNGRPYDARARVGSRVSFADVPQMQNLRRTADPEKLAMRTSGRERSTGSEYNVDFADAYPALALMRVKSNGEGVAFPGGEEVLTPTREFVPNGYFDREKSSNSGNHGIQGRTPDEMLKAYAAQMSGNERGDSSGVGAGVMKSVFSTVKKFGWRK